MFEATVFVENYDQLKAIYAVLAGLERPKEVFIPEKQLEPNVSLPPEGEEKATDPVSKPSEILECELDSAGVEWDAEIHASSRALDKDGTWRMKRGVKKEDELEAPANDNEPELPLGFDEDDEFASFKADISPREWSDNDLSKLCNQVAAALSNPAPVRALIAEFVAEGEMPHSRNIPADKREAFAKAMEAKAGITFAG